MNKRFLVLLLLAIIVAFLFVYSSMLQGEFYRIVNFFNELVVQNEPLAMVVFVLLAAVAALISPLTNIPLVPFAVVIWGAVPTTILLLSGWLIGDTLAYIVGRYLGHKTVSYFISEEKLDLWSQAIKKHTNFYRALFVRLVLPAELGYAFGIIRYPFWSYLLITFLAEVPFAIISTYASEAVLSGSIVKFFWLTAALFAIIFLAFRSLRKNS